MITATLALNVDLGTAGTIRVDADCASYEQLLEVLRMLEPITKRQTVSAPETVQISPALVEVLRAVGAVSGEPAPAAPAEPPPAPEPEPPAASVPASDPEPEPAQVRAAVRPTWSCPEAGCTEPGPYPTPQKLGSHRRYKHGPGYRATRADRVAAADPQPAFTSTEEDLDLDDDRDPEPRRIPPRPGPQPGSTPPASAVPGVILCGCGHAERMHERDEIAGRGRCHRTSCGCSEYRPAA